MKNYPMLTLSTRYPRLLFTLLLILASASKGLGAGSDTHRPAAQYAAMLSSEPFKSGWMDCFGAMVPDQMIDQPLAHENHRAAGMLYTHEAIRFLREKKYQKALFLASARSHYLTDTLAIAHCDVWKPRRENDVMKPGQHGMHIWSFLPKSVQEFQMPFGERREGMHSDPLLIDPPPLQRNAWDGLAKIDKVGSMHAFFDRTALHSAYKQGQFPLKDVPDTTNWSCYDREMVARWHAEQIALEMVDRDSVLAQGERIKFSDAEKMQKAFDHEMENMIAAVITYYRYLGVAADTKMIGDIDMLLPSIDRLVLMARHNPVIYISDKAPWPLRRTCMLLAMEIVRARYRAKGDFGYAYSKGLKEACEAMILPIEMPEGEDNNRVLVAWKTKESARKAAAGGELKGNNVVCAKGEQHGAHILLRGKDLQSTLHLIDYLLDLSYAPLNGKAPVEVLFRIFAKEWAGMQLMEDLKATAEKDVATRFEHIKSPQSHDHGEWGNKVHWLVWPHAQGTDANLSGVLPRFWNLFVLDLPQPDGAKVDLNAM